MITEEVSFGYEARWGGMAEFACDRLQAIDMLLERIFKKGRSIYPCSGCGKKDAVIVTQSLSDGSGICNECAIKEVEEYTDGDDIN